jgi:endonuclease G, mitochondrial
MKRLDALLRHFLSTLESADRPLAEEIRVLRSRWQRRDLPRSRRAPAGGGARAVRPPERNIVLRTGRPVLAIAGDLPQLEFHDAESTVWRARLQASVEPLRRAAQAVGRIDVTGLPNVPYVGTGWLVASNTIITNRHVAREFGRRKRGGFTFKKGLGAKPITASVDFLEEVERTAAAEFPIVEILHIEDERGPDFALLRIEDRAGAPSLAPPIPLASSALQPEQQVAVIGYPARDSRVPEAKLMQAIFGDVFDKKRLAPGQITRTTQDVVFHDCSTLGGNSGSVLLDLATGAAVGLHFAGRFLEANYAVPAPIVADRLERVLHRKPGRPPQGYSSYHSEPTTGPGAAAGGASATNPEVIVETVAADYVGRGGYDPAFVGPRIPLPTVKNRGDVLTFQFGGRRQTVLTYQHFSVVMSRSRRMCIYSAVNIDGATPRRFKRPAWRLDGRIPAAQQIRDECYGNEPLFSRGHMTRREDPIWGAPDEAALGNDDSMHVTNTVPQMQPFNAGIWLALESYALENARVDRMRISVFTGPFLLADDPVRAGVQIPRSFWKVIAFIHDDTRELCATGYTMSQEDFLRDEEFVFGRHKTSQTRITAIEKQAALRFGPLASLDAFEPNERGLSPPLTDLSQIQFVRRR